MKSFHQSSPNRWPRGSYRWPVKLSDDHRQIALAMAADRRRGKGWIARWAVRSGYSRWWFSRIIRSDAFAEFSEQLSHAAERAARDQLVAQVMADRAARRAQRGGKPVRDSMRRSRAERGGSSP